MIVTCPNCETQFNLADNLYTPGRKARCSVCSFLFILPAMPIDELGESEHVSLDTMDTSDSPDLDSVLARDGAAKDLPGELDDSPESEQGGATKPEKKNGGCLKRLFLLLALLVCLGGLGLGVYIIYFQGQIELPFKLPFDVPGLSGVPAGESGDPVAGRIADIDKVKDLLLIDVQHKYVQNVKLGPLVVISGKVRNNFAAPKEMIRVEASLLDKKGKVLATQQQFCGIMVPDIQLQVLGQKELAQAMDNRFDMLANNINVMPGVEVEFMVVFVYPPSNMAEYTVIVSDVSDPPNLAPQSGEAAPAAQ